MRLIHTFASIGGEINSKPNLDRKETEQNEIKRKNRQVA
jgi:hypothetical protein